MTLPNFLIIGAAKSGTTALHYYLKQHPQIYMSPMKEPDFFALEGERPENFQGKSNFDDEITDFETYCSLFKGVSNEVAVGESSTLYLYSSKASDRIKHYIPDVKLIAILRDPVERAYSHFLFNISKDNYKETITDFARAIQAEQERISNNGWFRWHYKQRGFYYVQLKRYFELFEGEQIKVYLYEDFKANSLVVLKDVFQFLGVDDNFLPNASQKHNVTYIPKNRSIKQLLDPWNSINSSLRKFVPPQIRKSVKTQILKFNRQQPPPLLPEVRSQLIEEYREDILKLQDLIQRDLSKCLAI